VTFRPTLRRSRPSPRNLCVLSVSALDRSFSFVFFNLQHSNLQTLQRFRNKSLPLNSFADPHPLTKVPSILYKNVVGRGSRSNLAIETPPSIWSGDPDPVGVCQPTDLSPLQCAVADRHRVLPVFSRNHPVPSPLDATLMGIPVSVDSKRFTVKAKSFRCNTYEKHEVGVPQAFQTFPKVTPNIPTFNLQTFKRSARPIAAKRLWCQNPQWHKFSSRSGETTPLLPVSKTSERTSGTARSWFPLQVVPRSSVLRRVSGFALTSPEQAGFRVCTYKP
jgi:hypothetical protein